jgi:polynucleotide 5'-kinase involved in rRNA processing
VSRNPKPIRSIGKHRSPEKKAMALLLDSTTTAADLAGNLIAGRSALSRKLLVLGETGSGRSLLTARLAGALAKAGEPATCISADIGSPPFGVPGAVCAGRWASDRWRATGMAAVCSLDAG